MALAHGITKIAARAGVHCRQREPLRKYHRNRCPSETSPGRGTAPPPINPASLMVCAASESLTALFHCVIGQAQHVEIVHIRRTHIDFHFYRMGIDSVLEALIVLNSIGSAWGANRGWGAARCAPAWRYFHFQDIPTKNSTLQESSQGQPKNSINVQVLLELSACRHFCLWEPAGRARFDSFGL
jgi:hypothetical protein